MLIFDIETAPLENAYKPEGLGEVDLSNPPEFKSRYKTDVEKRAADLSEKERAWREERREKAMAELDEWNDGALLNPDLARVCAIGMRYGGVKIGSSLQFSDCTEQGEKEIIHNLWQEMAAHDVIVGHNIYRFDLPFLWWRSRRLGVVVPRGIHSFWQGQISWDAKFIDTCKIAAQRPRKGSVAGWDSLDIVCEVLGIGSKGGKSGKDFYKMPREQQKEYLANDLAMTEELAFMMGVIHR